MRFLLGGSIPWWRPGVLLACVIGLLSARRVSGYLHVQPAVAFVMVVSLGLVLSATLTPLRIAIENGSMGSGTCDLSELWPVPPSQWLHYNDRTMNVLMFVPLGLAVGLVPRSPRKTALVAVAAAMPFLIEAAQLLAPVLSRGCDGADVVDNLTGLLLGLGAGHFSGNLPQLRHS